MSYKVGAVIKGNTFWTVDSFTNKVRKFKTKQEAEEFASDVWPDNWVVEEIKEQA
jgi:hypothetical protein